MKVRRLFNFSGPELAIALFFGIGGGIYIWRPAVKNLANSTEKDTAKPQQSEITKGS